MKSNLNGKEFQRARKTLGSVSGKRGYGVAIPQNLSEEASSEYVRIVQANGYTKNQISTRRYIFGYQGVTLETLKKYVLDMLRSGDSFWELPSAICILSRGICLIRDDGQVLPPYPAVGSSQSIYCVMQEGERALEFFMLHVLSSCLLAGGDLRVYGTPLRFHIYNYMEQPVHVKSLRGDIQQDLSKLKIAWKGKSHITTNDVLTRWEFEQQKC